MRTLFAVFLTAVAVVAAAAPALAVGMPQLDTSKFTTQIVWLTISFVVLLVLMSKVTLPRISKVLEERQHKIDGTLKKAESLKAEAEKASEAYQEALAEARDRAQDILREARERMAERAADKQAEAERKLNGEIEAAERSIAKARDAALANLREVALEVARSAVDRLSGEKPETGALSDSVDAALKERG